mmetsp:Transcript_44910/g.106609  ORF Transcript_44910/g.106609 Transcript_44910/m.106609 type:complete len:221 (+) Transcript_44910:1016-1678(+)
MTQSTVIRWSPELTAFSRCSNQKEVGETTTKSTTRSAASIGHPLLAAPRALGRGIPRSGTVRLSLCSKALQRQQVTAGSRRGRSTASGSQSMAPGTRRASTRMTATEAAEAGSKRKRRRAAAGRASKVMQQLPARGGSMAVAGRALLTASGRCKRRKAAGSSIGKRRRRRHGRMRKGTELGRALGTRRRQITHGASGESHSALSATGPSRAQLAAKSTLK